MSQPFIEEDFISALNAVLRQFFPTHRLRIDRISSWDEKGLGYDGTVTILKPIYIQFKRSEFYPANYRGVLRTKRNSLGLTASTFYSLKLHRDNSTRRGSLIHKQHNLLYALSQTQEAFYLAPLFHTKSELSDFNFSVHTNLPTAFEYEYYDTHRRRIIHRTNRINELIFADTIGIRPHKKVSDTKHHKYTFDKKFKVTFHSEPELLDGGGFNFLNYLITTLENYQDQKTTNSNTIYSLISEFCSSEKLPSFFEDLNEISEYYFSEKLDRKNIENLSTEKMYHIIELYLKDYFDIHQYILTK